MRLGSIITIIRSSSARLYNQGEGEYLEIITLDEFVERNVMESESNAEMAAKVERLIDGYDVGARCFLLCLPGKTFIKHERSTKLCNVIPVKSPTHSE